MRLYRDESSDPKTNAQRNLMGRTHYVDDETLRFHHSRVISARVIDNGLLFAIVTSDAKDMHNTARGFRYVIFDLFGTVVERNPSAIDMEFFRTSEKATKAMWAAVNEIDAKKLSRAAIDTARGHYEREMAELTQAIAKLESDGK